jgi:AraC-like DNA-binding protein
MPIQRLMPSIPCARAGFSALTPGNPNTWGVSYREGQVDRGLGLWVECVWSRAGGERPDAYERIVPDGCMDLIWSEPAGVTAIGPNTTAFLSPLRPGASVVGVRLHPGAAPSLFGVPAPALRDGRMPAAALWGDSGARLEEHVASAATPDERLRRLVAFIAERARQGGRPDPLVGAAVARLGRAAVGDVARELAVSERHLRRLVNAEVGYGPKRLGRVLRLRRALARVRAGAELAEVAFGCGYADQAHFTNECNALAGLPPGRFLQDRAA